MDTLLDASSQPPMSSASLVPSMERAIVDVGALATVDTSGQWYLRGACRGLDAAIFYPDPDIAEDVARALAVCEGCDVRETCLAHALGRRELTGIWGGTTERERRQVLRRHRSA